MEINPKNIMKVQNVMVQMAMKNFGMSSTEQSLDEIFQTNSEPVKNNKRVFLHVTLKSKIPQIFRPTLRDELLEVYDISQGNQNLIDKFSFLSFKSHKSPNDYPVILSISDPDDIFVQDGTRPNVWKTSKKIEKKNVEMLVGKDGKKLHKRLDK